MFHVEPEALEEGEKLLTLWAERLKNCEASGVFPPYVDCTVPLVWPKEDEFYEDGQEIGARIEALAKTVPFEKLAAISDVNYRFENKQR